ncbi:MAG: nucleotidyltransferase family protein [Candidatus Micrarchaeia archaeon]
MIGIILAAGKGTRLRPLTYAIPKPLLPVGGRPVLEYAIENLTACKEIKKIYIAVSHQRELIEAYLQHVNYGIEVETVHTLGWETGGDLKTILNEKKINEPVIVAYGDIVSKIDTNELLEFHRKNGKIATVALFEVPDEDVNRFGIADVDSKSGTIRQFVEKPKLEDAPSNLANTGYYILEKKAQDELSLEKKRVEEMLFPKLAERGELAGHVCKPSYWLDIGTIESYRKAKRLVEGILAPNKKE